jgi:hypothetical protein
MSRRLLALALACAAALTGCAAIPTAGPINTGSPVLIDPGQPIPLISEPLQDGSPEQIVYGFLAASAAGLADQYAGARRYLTTAAAASWVPTASVLIYPSTAQPTVAKRDDGTVLVEVPVQGSLDATGVYTEAPAAAPGELAMGLVKNADGQWRISSLDNGVVMSAADFNAYFRQMAVYFVSVNGSYLVPDVRWFPANGIQTSAARALLAGPSQWLRDVVRTGAPDGTRLGPGGVAVSSDKVATVDLSVAASGASAEQRDLLIAQMTQTLERFTGAAISDVKITVGGGEPWQPTTDTTLIRDPQPDSGPYVIADRRLQVLKDGKVSPVPSTVRLPAGAHDVALSMDGTLRGVLDGDAMMMLPTDGSEPVDLFQARGLLSPSIDPFDWAWTAVAGGTGLVAVSATGEVMHIDGDWLTGTNVRSIAVSRDGSRIAVVHVGDGAQPVIDVASVLRDDSGRPQRLGASFTVGQSLTDATQVEWMDESTLAVLGLSGSLVAPTLHLVAVGGPSYALPLVDQPVTIAAGRGDRALYIVDEKGSLLWRQGAAWTAVASGIQDVVFPG